MAFATSSAGVEGEGESNIGREGGKKRRSSGGKKRMPLRIKGGC
jgi:hypothetical protein